MSQINHLEQLRRAHVQRLAVERKLEECESERDDLYEMYREDVSGLNEKLERESERAKAVERNVNVLESERSRLLGELERLGAEHEALTRELTSLEARLAFAQRHKSIALSVARATKQKWLGELDSVKNDLSVTSARLDTKTQELAQSKAAYRELEEEFRRKRPKTVQFGERIRRSRQLLKSIERSSLDFVDLTRRHYKARLKDSRALKTRLHEFEEHRVLLEFELEALRESIAYGFGRAVADAFRSWGGALRFPARILKLIKRARHKKDNGVELPKTPIAELNPVRVPSAEEVNEIVLDKGIKSVEKKLDRCVRKGADPDEISLRYLQLARLSMKESADLASVYAWRSLEYSFKSARRRDAALLFYNCGDLTAANLLWNSLDPNGSLTPSAIKKGPQIVSKYAQFRDGIPLPPAEVAPVYSVNSRKVYYVAAMTLPYTNSGYSHRTHNLLSSLRARDVNVCCVSRPGYPHDRGDNQIEEILPCRTVDSVSYEVLPGPKRTEVTSERYLVESADILQSDILQKKPSIIQAASNHENAAPALLAARRLGLPFIYEIRGLWELSSASKKPGWKGSDQFRLHQTLETEVAINADRVFALNEALRDEFIARGVAPDRIEVLPHAIESSDLSSVQRDHELAESLSIDGSEYVFGYFGAMVPYEGLDDLIAAAAIIRNDPTLKFRVILGGGGSEYNRLVELVRRSGLSDVVDFVGSLSPDEVRRHLSLVDCVVIARKPVEVSEMVTPIKPFEAMDAAKPLIVSSVAPLRELVVAEESGLIFKAGDAGSLADQMKSLVQDPEWGREMGRQARETVCRDYSWDTVVDKLVKAYDELSRVG